MYAHLTPVTILSITHNPIVGRVAVIANAATKLFDYWASFAT